jgi:hypothetical protein
MRLIIVITALYVVEDGVNFFLGRYMSLPMYICVLGFWSVLVYTLVKKYRGKQDAIIEKQQAIIANLKTRLAQNK